MIKFYDSGGTVHFGQATITRKTSVNGGLSLTGEVFAGDDVLNGLDYGWWLNFDNEKYVITYKKLSDDTNTVVFDAVQQFFWDFAKVALHAQYTGSHEYTFYLGQLFDKSGYTYKNDATVPAFEKENWGYKNKLDLFNDIIDQAGVEFEVHNETVHIAKQLGSDLTSFVRKGINLSDLTEEMKISDFATYARGYGAFKDDQDQSKGRLEVEYRSELAKKFGDLEMDPIVDERYTIADNLIAALKKQVDATYTVSMTMNIYDLENAGYPNYEAPKVGDWILAIDEALNFKRKIRIIQLEEQFDVTGKRIGYTATCGDLSIVDQYTHLQSSLDSKVQRIQESVDAAATSANGKNTNYYGAKEPVSANEGDLWFDQSNSDPDKWSIKQWVNGRWEQITLNPGEIDAKVNVAKQEAETAVENAKSASDKADQLASKYDDTSSLASQAMNKAVSAQSDASSAVATANSTASDFGKVNQKADSAVASALNAQSDASDAVAIANSTASDFGKVSQKTDNALTNSLNAQSDASDAVKQASSAAADSKDAKQIAGAVSQSYKTLTDGSTMTIAELESGLAVKLTKTDLNGYATQTWTQNQIKVTADGINGTMSSIKSTVDGQTTSINDLKADSSSFKSQFTTVNNTLGKQTTDIGSLQATSKELTTGFNTLTTDNNTNKNDISQLKQTATEVSSTLETVQTQIQNIGNLTHSFNANTSHPGYTSGDDGTLYDWAPYKEHRIDYAPIDPTKSYFIEVTATVPATSAADNFNWLGFTFYDKDKKFICRVDSNGVKMTVSGQCTTRIAFNYSDPDAVKSVTIPANAAYVIPQARLYSDGVVTWGEYFATQTWTQTQIKMTADGINGTISSVKGTVDGHTTSINDLKADSSSFKSQFTTVNDTLGKHTTDIGSLQTTSKELTTGFNTLTTDNTTNKNDISQLKQTATEVSSTLETVQTQVQNSSVGTNLFSQSTATGGYVDASHGNINPPSTTTNENVSDYISVGASSNYTFQMWGTTPSGAYYWYGIGLYDSDKKFISRMSNVGRTYSSDTEEYVSKTLTTTSTTAYVRVSFRKYNNYKVKLEKGSVATDYSVNPEDTATVTAMSKLSQTVDGMKSDISKKIEHKDLNGYATQTWARNQINSTADGINATLSSVKKTVDGQSTSINDLKADSSSFKSQFTTVNNTLGKQTTDIGTLQATSKSLSANFDSLSSDNKTNQHNISQLQASATKFNNTLMTVQTQVQNSAVGTNLIQMSNTTAGYVNGANGTIVGANSTQLERVTDFIEVEPNKTYCMQEEVYLLTGQYLWFGVGVYDGNKDFINRLAASGVPVTANSTDFKKLTMVMPDNAKYVRVSFRTYGNARVKLEKGSVATDWCRNPADNATVTAVSSISQTVDSIQTTVRGKVDNDVYQSKVTNLSNQITSVVGQVNNLGQKNLIVNSQFQYDWQSSWGVSSSVRKNWYTSDYSWAWLDGYQGICANIPQSQSESWPHIASSDVAVPDPGVTAYSASVYVNIDWVETYCVLDMSFYNAAGVRTFHDTTASNKGLNFLKLENIVSPKDAVRVHIELHVHDHGHVAFIKPMLVQDSSVGKYIPDNASWTEVQQTYNSINLKVSKDGVINAINVSPEGTTIYGNKLRITAATYIDNAVIKDAMIASLNASKLHAGRIDASKIDVYNLNGSKIVAHSITADKLQAGSMLIAMNSTLQTLKIGTDGLYTTDRSGNSIGRIHTNRSVQHPEHWGLDFDLDSAGKFMSWGAENEGDPNGDYDIKFGWTRNSSAHDFGMPWGGFWFNDNVMLHKNLRFDGGGVDVKGAYQLMKFAWISMNGIKYPFFGSSNLKAGWLFGSYETYLVRNGGVINASKVLGTLNGQNLMVPTKIRSDGTIAVYTTYHL